MLKYALVPNTEIERLEYVDKNMWITGTYNVLLNVVVLRDIFHKSNPKRQQIVAGAVKYPSGRQFCKKTIGKILKTGLLPDN